MDEKPSSSQVSLSQFQLPSREALDVIVRYTDRHSRPYEMRSMLVRWHHELEHSVGWIAQQLGTSVAVVKELFRLYEVEDLQLEGESADALGMKVHHATMPLNLSSSAIGTTATQLANAFAVAHYSWERTAKITGRSLVEIQTWVVDHLSAIVGIQSDQIRDLFPRRIIPRKT